MTQSAKKAWEGDRLRDPIWQFLSVVVALIVFGLGSLLTYVLYQVAQPRPALTLTVVGKYPNMWFSKEESQELEVRYRGKKADNVSSLLFRIENTGGTAVRPEDFIAPLSLAFDTTGEVVRVWVNDEEPETMDIQTSPVISNTVQFTPSLWNPGDTVVFVATILNETDDSKPVSITPSGRIVGVQEVVIETNPVFRKIVFEDASFKFSIKGIVFIAPLMLGMLASVLYLLRETEPELWASRRIILHILFLAASSVVMVAWFWAFIQSMQNAGGSPQWMYNWMLYILAGAVFAVAYLIYVARLIRRRLKARRGPQPANTAV